MYSDGNSEKTKNNNKKKKKRMSPTWRRIMDQGVWHKGMVESWYDGICPFPLSFLYTLTFLETHNTFSERIKLNY